MQDPRQAAPLGRHVRSSARIRLKPPGGGINFPASFPQDGFNAPPERQQPPWSQRRGRANQFVHVHGCYPGQFSLSEIAQSEFSQELAFEQRVRGVRDEYLPRLGRVA